MKIRNVLHRGLKRFIELGDASGLNPAQVGKIGRMVSFLQDMSHENELLAVPTWRAHRLSGDRRGTWSLFVSRNWRMTFRIDAGIEIVDLNYQDYH